MFRNKPKFNIAHAQFVTIFSPLCDKAIAFATVKEHFKGTYFYSLNPNVILEEIFSTSSVSENPPLTKKSAKVIKEISIPGTSKNTGFSYPSLCQIWLFLRLYLSFLSSEDTDKNGASIPGFVRIKVFRCFTAEIS